MTKEMHEQYSVHFKASAIAFTPSQNPLKFMSSSIIVLCYSIIAKPLIKWTHVCSGDAILTRFVESIILFSVFLSFLGGVIPPNSVHQSMYSTSMSCLHSLLCNSPPQIVYNPLL